MGKMHYGKPVQNPGEPEIVREWRERHPDAERPIFDDAVKIAGKTLDEGYLGPDQASPSDWRFFFRDLEDGGDYALRSWWLPAADRSSDYWDSMKLTAARYLRDREPMPDALADWLVEGLEGKRKKPRKRSGRKTFSLQNMWIMGAVNTFMQLGMNPTRNIASGGTPCANGGSTCDAVGVELEKLNTPMTYKTVEKSAGAPPSPTSRYGAASFTCWRSWTGRAGMCWPSACRTPWMRASASRHSTRRWPAMARWRSSIPTRAASSLASPSPGACGRPVSGYR